MPDTPTPQGDKARKPRPFGSFLLFLTVLVVVLIAFGGSHFKGAKQLTHDQFEWFLNTGQVEEIKLKGRNDVTGVLADKGRERPKYKVSYANIEDYEASFQELNAISAYLPIPAEQLKQAIESGLLAPEKHRHLTAIREARIPVVAEGETNTEESVRTNLQQEDHLYVGGTVGPLDKWRGIGFAAVDDLPIKSGKVWFHVQSVDDLVSLKTYLADAGSTGFDRTFNLTDERGLAHGKADTTLTTALLMWGPWILIFAVFILFMRQMRNQGSGAGVMSFGRSRAQLYSKENHTNVTFDDVAGAQEAKDEVREVVEFLKNPGRFTRIGGRIPRGVLLVGSPGCGKTLLAKAIAGEAEVPFFSISGSDFVEMFVGVGASRVRDLFKQARENSPCIIFLDEIDAVGRRRGSGMGGGHDEREQTLNAILVEMDGFGTDEGIIVVAATNRPDVLDPALLRPGRFDREVMIELPDMEGREAILRVHLKKVQVDEDVDVKSLARSTPGYSGADLAAIVNEAAIMAVLDKRDKIEMRHLDEAAAKVRYGRKKTSRKIEEEDLEITAYHEAGHTIVAAKISEVDMPHKVTIVPRGRALGATMMLPEKESYHMQRRRLNGQLAMAFGGRIAEETFCGDISAGASDDIRRATELARAMVTELGMSEKVGPINYADRQGSDFLGTELMSGKWHSEETAHVIDEEIERLLREAYSEAKRIIEIERGAIERLKDALLLYETLESGEITRLIDGVLPADLREAKPGAESPAVEAQETRQMPEATSNGDLGDLPGEAGLSPA
ncbi:MAG: ATP-dependent zinc metalloprotease FtsH [bacterium]|nr:ATP-dependent zinc metalloprotease FtsH [bacterium]